MKESDLYLVQQYLLRSVTRASFWKGIDFQTKNTAVTELHALPDSIQSWQTWIDSWLTVGQKDKLNASIRKARMRTKGKDITISEKAHQMLVALSDNGRLSLSQVIEQRLHRAYQQKLKSVDN